jgi:hypothetical protein
LMPFHSTVWLFSVLDICFATCSIPLEIPCICQHIHTITVRHSLLIQSLSLKPFVSYLLNIDLFRDLRELLRSDYILIESLAVMLSTGITGGAYKLDPEPLMRYPCLLAWCWSGILTVFFRRVHHWHEPLHHSYITMVQTHLCFRYAWTLARQLPGSAPSSSAF